MSDVVPNTMLELAIGLFCLVCIGISVVALWILLGRKK